MLQTVPFRSKNGLQIFKKGHRVKKSKSLLKKSIDRFFSVDLAFFHRKAQQAKNQPHSQLQNLGVFSAKQLFGEFQAKYEGS